MDILEGLAVLLALAVAAWILTGPILTFVLWSRIGRLEDEISRLRRDRLSDSAYERELAAKAAEGTAPQAAVEPPPLPPLTVQGASAPTVSGLTAPPVEPEVVEAEVAEEPVAAGKTSLAASIAQAIQKDRDRVAKSPAAGLPSFSLEELLAGKWLTYVGALAVVIGAGFFFKYTIDAGLIGPTGRVVLGVLAGMCLFVGGAAAMVRKYRFFAEGLVGAALGILYFSLFAAFAWYHILPQNAAFFAMILVTAAGLAFSAYFNAQATAILSLLGGFLTPIMLSTGQDAQWTLFSYILLLDLGVLGVATFRKWQPLQILAFVLTLVVWLGWFGQHYVPEKLASTLVLMTAFFLLFALLGVWHNVLRQRKAEPGDFVLILLTPVAYFIGLYGVTNERYSFLHGLMAVALAGTYLALGLFALVRNPAGKKVVVALCGVAASFLTVAIPLQLTGHWIVIAWAAESLLLVEMGLRFNERKLRYAGFGLLASVQILLLFYGLETLNNPRSFETRFTQAADIIAETFNPNGTPAPVELERPPVWREILNGRMFSFLASAIVMGVLAWEYRRRNLSLAPLPNGLRIDSLQLAGVLIAGAPLTLLALLMLESFSFGYQREWLPLSIIGLCSVWTALVALLVLKLAGMTQPRWLGTVALCLFGLMALLLGINFFATLEAWRYMWSTLIANGGNSGWWATPVLNPRGLGYLAGLAATVAGYFISRRPNKEESVESIDRVYNSPFGGLHVSQLLGLLAYVTGFALLTIEVFAQGVIREWHTATSLAVTFTWTLYAIATLVAGIYFRSAMVRILALVLFLLTAGKVFLYDVWYLDKTIRTLAFIGLGLSLLLVSYLYRRFRDRIRAWIQPAALVLVIPTALAWLEASAQAANPTITRATELSEALSHRAPILSDGDDAAGTRETSLTRIVLPLELYGVARQDLGDVRVLQGSPLVEVPYVVVRPQDSLQHVIRKAPLLNLSERGGATEFLLDLGDAAEPVNALEIDVQQKDENYERSVSVYGADRRDAEDWNLLTKDAYLLDVTRPGKRFRVNRVEFPQSQFHYYKVVIDNGEQPPLHVAGATLSDLRRVQAPRRILDVKILSQEHDANVKVSRIVFDLGYGRLPTIKLEMRVDSATAFYRPVTLEATDRLEEKPRWQAVASGQIYRIDRARAQASDTAISYPETPARYLRLTIVNGDDQPLRISDGTATMIDKSLVLGGNSKGALREAFLYAGNVRLTAPQYDLARTIGDVSLASLPELKLGPLAANPLFKGPALPDVPWSEQNKALLWTGSIVGVLVLGGLTVLLLRKAASLPAEAGE